MSSTGFVQVAGAAGAAVVLKAATGAAAKAAVTAAAVAVTGPTVKAVSIGATVAQLAVQKYRADKLKKKIDELEEDLAVAVSISEAAASAEAAARAKMARMRWWASRTDELVARLPRNAPKTFRLASVTGGALVGFLAPAALWSKGVKLGMGAALAAGFASTWGLRRAQRVTHTLLEVRTADLALAAKSAAEAAVAVANSTDVLQKFRPA